jgi:two-component system, OmpR family, response regulator
VKFVPEQMPFSFSEAEGPHLNYADLIAAVHQPSRPNTLMRLARSLARVMMDERCSSGAYDAARGASGVTDSSAKKGHIVVVDDDEAIRRMVADYLIDHQLSARTASNRVELDHCFTGTDPSLILLDVRLGHDDGFDLLREIRSHCDVPIIMMTGHRLDEIDRVAGLNLGADDYIVKPFSLRELLARIRAVLRRQVSGRGGRDRGAQWGGYRFDGWQLDRRRRRLVEPGGRQVSLSKGEYSLLLAFLESPQRVLTREHLLQATHLHDDIFDRSIDVQVLRLRRKLELNPSAAGMIRTERGVGYVFALPVEPY